MTRSPLLVGGLVLALLLPVAPSFGAGETPPGEEEIHALVTRAQEIFRQGEQAWNTGRKDRARELFDRAHALLLDAEQASMGRWADRFYRVYEIYYRERSRYDLDPGPSRDVVLETAREVLGSNPLREAQVRYQVDLMVHRHREFLDRSFRRALRYIPMIRQEFSRAGVPPALAYMALVESGFRHSPRSSAGARGLWQFMPATARRFGLHVGRDRDERLDPVLSTRAAARYLRYLHGLFDDWPLAVAAYNAGEGRVRRALARTGAKTFWELAERGALPRETIDYVPRIVAVTLIARAPSRYGFAGFTPPPETTR